MQDDPILSLDEAREMDKVIPDDRRALRGAKRLDCFRAPGPQPFLKGMEAIAISVCSNNMLIGSRSMEGLSVNIADKALV